MNQQLAVKAPYDPIDSLQVVKDSVAAFNQILIKANEELQKIQATSGTSTLFNSLLSLPPLMSKAGTPNFVWHLPMLYQTETERMLRCLLDSAGVLSRSQQSILELTAQSMSRTAQQTANAMTTVNETLASRRVSAEIIDFADRRAKAQAISARAVDTSDEQDISQPKARKAAG